MTAVVDQERELASLRKLWLILAILSLAICLNVLIATQGGAVNVSVKATLGFEFNDDTPEAIAGLWGVVYLSVVLVVASAALVAHARKVPRNWAERYPFRVFDLPPSRGIGAGAQVIAVVLLTLLPIYTLGHSWSTMTKHGALCTEQSGMWSLAPDGRDLWAGSHTDLPIRLTSSEQLDASAAGASGPKCSGIMTDYWAPGETLLLTLMTTLGIIGGLGSLALLWVPQAKHSLPNPEVKE